MQPSQRLALFLVLTSAVSLQAAQPELFPSVYECSVLDAKTEKESTLSFQVMKDTEIEKDEGRKVSISYYTMQIKMEDVVYTARKRMYYSKGDEELFSFKGSDTVLYFDDKTVKGSFELGKSIYKIESCQIQRSTFVSPLTLYPSAYANEADPKNWVQYVKVMGMDSKNGKKYAAHIGLERSFGRYIFQFDSRALSEEYDHIKKWIKKNETRDTIKMTHDREGIGLFNVRTSGTVLDLYLFLPTSPTVGDGLPIDHQASLTLQRK